MQGQHVYQEKYIVKRFMPEEFDKIPKRNIMAQVINIRPNQNDSIILKKWENHFRQNLPIANLPEPYIIIKDPVTGIKMLWKERRA